MSFKLRDGSFSVKPKSKTRLHIPSLNFAPLHASVCASGARSTLYMSERKILKHYPIFWNITGKICVVVGGGEVAARKVARLLECKAKVYVISPELVPELADMKREGLIEHISGLYEGQYPDHTIMIIGATDDEKINAAVSQDAQARDIPVNIVDDPQKCDFILPSLVERGELTIACSTGGNSPALAKQIRKELEATYGEEYSDLVNILGKLREKMEKNAGKGQIWFEKLMAEGLLDRIRKKDKVAIRQIILDVSGEEVDID